MQKYVYENGRVLQDVTDEVKKAFPKITLTSGMYTDVTDEVSNQVAQLYSKVEPRIKKKKDYENLIQSYQAEVVKLNEEIRSIVKYYDLDESIIKAIDPSKAEILGL